MSGVRVLVGTRKGAFILSSDEQRSRWKVSGPHFADGKSIISKDLLLTRIDSTLRKRAVGSGRSSAIGRWWEDMVPAWHKTG